MNRGKIFVNFFLATISISNHISLASTYAEGKNFKVFENARIEDFDFWMKEGEVELETSLERFRTLIGDYHDEGYEFLNNVRRPKNLILFIGDGLGIPTVTAARIYKGQTKFQTSGEETNLIWDNFPETALLKTYNTNKQTPDSAGTATALFSGVKTTYKTLGFDSSIVHNSPKSHKVAKEVTSILDWAQESGKKTGFVTTARITHATPAALYAHSASRDWECDSFMKKSAGNVLPDEEDPNPDDILDIARQLIEKKPGNQTNVILGGGRLSFKPSGDRSNNTVKKSKWNCERSDGLDLIQKWIDEKRGLAPEKSHVVTNREELSKIDPEKTEFLFGSFTDGHILYEDENNLNDPKGQPNLAEMSLKAVEVLKRSSSGFFLMVEGGRIDHAHHDGFANRALLETLGFEDALGKVMESLKATNQLEETLIIVTADHSHVMTMMGYPPRGADIRGVTGGLANDKLPEPILTYANGPGYEGLTSTSNCTRRNLNEVDMFDFNYKAPAAVPMRRETHGGEDVGLWATGPMSFLFHKTHEQSYVAHAAAFSLCAGPYRSHKACLSIKHPRNLKISTSSIILSSKILALFSIVIALCNIIY